jgi:hypothetical protein
MSILFQVIAVMMTMIMIMLVVWWQWRLRTIMDYGIRMKYYLNITLVKTILRFCKDIELDQNPNFKMISYSPIMLPREWILSHVNFLR